jgi:hypothetical protein
LIAVLKRVSLHNIIRWKGNRLMIGIVVAMMVAGSGADSRHDFAECLKQADSKAQAQKIGADGFVAFAQSACASAEGPFEASLVNSNVSHGMSKKAAATDAALQVSDYYSERLDNYKVELQPLPAQAAAAPPPTTTPAPTPAAAPAQPK